MLNSPRPHRPQSRVDSSTCNPSAASASSSNGSSQTAAGECPPTPTHRPKPLRPLPLCPSSNSALTSEEPLPPCKLTIYQLFILTSISSS